MKIQKYITGALVLIGISQTCSAEQVTFKNDTALPVTVTYGKNKGNGKHSINGKTDPIAPYSSAAFNLDLNANDMFHAKLVPSSARGNLSKDKSTYTILLDGQSLRIS